MSDRFRMNRLGFVNFWLYDVEEFPLEDGKLLLRGQNGSGKSITTQSFIPFILDGDRTPSRLDPFGSSDRRMDYYFLGEDGKDESTGYLYLEFFNKETGEYRTIGIGQRARKGKPMDFWGFILLDQRRIEYDFFLYDEVGSSRIPLGRNELKKRLGDQNLFTDSQKEYKSWVNKYLFGFQREEQYEQYIRLLVKVRAPKLSKEFKPTKVYEILNDSLQTLTDEDLRPMVDAMEKMDSIQASLEQLSRAFGDVKIIRNEYLRYNLFMLGRKAKAYLEEKQRAEEARKKYEKQQGDLQAFSEEAAEKKQQQAEAAERLTILQNELLTLLEAGELSEISSKLTRAQREEQEYVRMSQELEQRLERNRGEERIAYQEQKQIEDDLEYLEDQLTDDRKELDSYQEELRWEGHEKAKSILEQRNLEAHRGIQMQLLQYQKEVRAGKEAVEKQERLQQQYDGIAGQAEQAKEQMEEAAAAVQYQETQLEKVREHHIQELYEKNEANSAWILSKEQLSQAEHLLDQYEAGDAAKLAHLFLEAFQQLEDPIRRELLKLQAEEEEQQSSRSRLQQEYEELQAQAEIEPVRSEAVETSRQRLLEAGVTPIPFYKTIEFSKQLSEEQCGILESQLSDLGILDALVVTEKEFLHLQKHFPELTDCVLKPQVYQAEGTFSAFTISEETAPELVPVVAGILSRFEENGKLGAGAVLLGSEREYAHGILWGKAEKKPSAEYIGVLSRKQKKERILAELREQIRLCEEQIEHLQAKLSEQKERQQMLRKEYGEAVTTEALEEQIAQLHKKQLILEGAKQLYEAREAERVHAEQELKDHYQELLKLCRPLPYGRTVREYGNALEQLEEYKEIWGNLGSLLRSLESKRGQKQSVQEKIEHLERTIDELFLDKDRSQQKLREIQAQIQQYEEILKDPELMRKAEELKRKKAEERELQAKLRELQDTLIRLDERITQLQKSEESLHKDVLEKTEKENLLRKYFEEELALSLVFERQEKTLEACAREAVRQIRKGDEEREAAGIFQSLQNVFVGHSSNLISYNTSLEECFEDAAPGSEALRKRYRIASSWNGKKVYLEEFFQILKRVIEETELLIQAKDRELFEDILSKTISQQLTDRIGESRRWVQDMSELLKLDTSMGLFFSLEWKPRTAESEQELDIASLEKILARDRELLTDDDIEKVAVHFRSKIRSQKRLIEESGLPVNYMDLVRDALDYRKWFAFQMYYYRGEKLRRPLTNAAFNKFSGGEKAMAMYAPLFAAVNAQYHKAANPEHPRMIALDEAFAGVDDKNISSMFQLVTEMDFDYIMNSQALWGCYESVPALHISDLQRPLNSQTVTVIHYTWNGHERILDEQ